MILLFCHQCHKEILLNWVSCRNCNTKHFKILNCLECFSEKHPNVCQDDDGWILFYRYPKENLKLLMSEFSEENLQFSQIPHTNKLNTFRTNSSFPLFQDTSEDHLDKSKKLLY